MIRLKELKEAIEATGLKRKFIAEKVEITKGSFDQLMSGNCEIGIKKAISLAKLLKVDLYEIWQEK